jgi:hypothetical protein
MAMLDMPIKTMWSEVQKVRERVESLLADVNEDVRAATVMTASELIENAIKYGETVPAAPQASVRLEHVDDTIEIVVKNGVADEATVRDLKLHVDRIANASDRMVLYMDRLRELMMSGGVGGSKLGLYRICCEGGFDLRCDYLDGVVTLTATRRVTA